VVSLVDQIYSEMISEGFTDGIPVIGGAVESVNDDERGAVA